MSTGYHAIQVDNKYPVEGTALGTNPVLLEAPQRKRNRGLVLSIVALGVLATVGAVAYLIVNNQSLFHSSSSGPGSDCITSFTSILGEANGQVAYSNCKADYASSEMNSVSVAGNSVPTGSRWTSVEYVTRYVAKTANIYIGSLYDAAAMWGIDVAITIGSVPTQVPVTHFGNGLVFAEGSAAMPKVGDIIVYAQQSAMNLPNGHVAVVVGLGSGEVHVAEQNWSNQAWQYEGYSRAISYNILSNNQGGTAYQLSDYSYSQGQYYTILGWKRIMTA